MNDYNYEPSIYTFENFVKSDIGIKNSYKIFEIVQSLGENNIFVDLGVWHGFSSHLLLIESKLRNNLVFGVDVKFDDIYPSLRQHSNYHTILGDSSTVGKYWKSGEVALLFIDTLHVKQQVMTELYFWYDLVKPGGWIIFHDTCWPSDKYDNYMDINWPRPEEAIKEFFKVDKLDYEDDNLMMFTEPTSNGMTFIQIKRKVDYKSLYTKWRTIFDERNYLTSYFDFTRSGTHLYETF